MNVKPCAIAVFMALPPMFAVAPDHARADDADHYTIEEVQACSGDAIQFCADVLTDTHKVEACMIAHKAQLSRACQAMFDNNHSSN